MADEITPTVEAASEPVTVIVDETSPPENDAEVVTTVASVDVEVKGNNNNKGKNKRDKKEQVPIEELYDLTKPIKRVSSWRDLIVS